MKAFSQRLGIAVAGLLLAAGPALAQRPEPGAGGGGGDRGGGGGAATASGGAATASGGGGGGNIASGGGGGGSSSSSSSSSGGGFSNPSISSISSPSIGMGDRSFRASAPEHRVNYSSSSSQRPHTASSGEQAVPRASGGGSSSSSGSSGSNGSSGSSAPSRSTASERPSARSESGGGERASARGEGVARGNAANARVNESATLNNAGNAREVPNWSRPRGDRPVTDTAVPRIGPQPPRDSGDRNNPGRYYDPYYYWGGGGWGGSYYDCFSNYYAYYGGCSPSYIGYPYYSPFGFGYGIPYGMFDPYYADPYDYGAGYGSYSSRVYGGQDQGQLKLKVKPRNAKVYVDGYYVGLVDEFDGAFQKLTLNGGRHKVELRADGYESAEFDVLITPDQTVTFAGDMKRNQ